MEDSDNDIEITLDADPADGQGGPELPATSMAAGGGRSIPQVSFTAHVKMWIEEYATHDVSRERGGVLLGRVDDSGGAIRVSVEAAIDAAEADEQTASIRFTHRTWDHISTIKDERYPHLRIVGWFHTHPGYGIFLSRYDTFIHENFFSLPFQIAYVIDPRRGVWGVFGWSEGGIRQFSEDAVGVPAAEPLPLPRSGIRWGVAGAVAVVAAAVVLGFAVSLHRAGRADRGLDERHEPPSVEPREQRGSEPPATQSRAAHSAIPATVPEAVPVVVSRITAPGDTLWELSREYLGDPRRWHELLELNGLPDQYSLLVGVELRLPPDAARGSAALHESEGDSPPAASPARRARRGEGQRDRDGRDRE